MRSAGLANNLLWGIQSSVAPAPRHPHRDTHAPKHTCHRKTWQSGCAPAVEGGSTARGGGRVVARAHTHMKALRPPVGSRVHTRSRTRAPCAHAPAAAAPARRWAAPPALQRARRPSERALAAAVAAVGARALPRPRAGTVGLLSQCCGGVAEALWATCSRVIGLRRAPRRRPTPLPCRCWAPDVRVHAQEGVARAVRAA